MKAFIFPVILQIMGFFVIVAEIFIPSLGLLTLIALGVYAYSLYLVYTTISTTAGMIFTGIDIVCVPIVLIFGMKMLAGSPLSLRQQLSKEQGVVSQGKDQSKLLNMKGVAVTDLRPAGTALINDQRMDVVTDGEYVEKQTPIVVTGISGNRVVVEQNREERNRT